MTKSEKDIEYERLLAEALKQPGIREASELYNRYDRIARQVDSIRPGMRQEYTTTDSFSDPRP